MRLLFVSHKYPPQKGGVGVSAQRLCRSFASWCESVHVLHVTREIEPGLVQSSDIEGVQVFTLGETDRGAESGQLLESTIRALHDAHSYQAVIGFYAVPTGYQAVLAARFLGLPSLLCLRGNDVDRALYHDGQQAALRWALEQATKVVAVSRELAAKAKLFSGRAEVEFVANSVDGEIFYPTDTQPLPKSLLFTGEMRLKKGSDLLLHSLGLLEGDWTLTVMGGFRGRAEAKFRKWAIRNRETAARVHLIPYARDVDQLRDAYNKAALVINPALWDGMPNSVLEAMACGRPVLSTQVGGVSDLVRHGETGYLLKLSELDELADRINRIWEMPEIRTWGKAAREHVLQHHSPAGEASAFRSLLESMI